MLQHLGLKLTTLLNTREPRRLNENASLSLETQRAYFKTHSIKDLLGYESYHEGIYINASTAGFILESMPLVGFTGEAHATISSLFQTVLPEGSNIQFLLFADPFIGDALAQWQKPRLKQGDMMAKMAEERTAYFKRLAGDTQSDLSARSFRVLISVTRPLSKETTFQSLYPELIELKERLVTIFKMAHMHTVGVEPATLLSFIDDFFTCQIKEQDFKNSRIEYSPLDFLCDQAPIKNTTLEVTPNGLRLNGGEKMFKAYRVTHYPSRKWTQSEMGDLIGDSFQMMQQIQYPFYLHYGVHIPKQEELKLKYLAKYNHLEKQIKSPMAKYIPSMAHEWQEYGFVKLQLDSNHRFVRTNFTAAIIAPEAEIHKADQTLMNVFRAKGFTLFEDCHLHLQSFLTLLPMRFGDDFLKDLNASKKLKTTMSSESANLMPIQGEWMGTDSPGMLLLGRRGQLTTWSPFDNKGGNYNVSVVGRSGSGKSVFMQELMTSTLGQGGRVFVLDVGRSFEKTCLLLGGQFIEFTTKVAKGKSPLCINPFSTIDPASREEAEDALAMLKSVICTMVAPTQGVSDLERTYLEKAMTETFQRFGRKTTMTKIAAYLNESSDQRMRDLASQLYPYTNDGMYGKFFEGDANVDFTNPLVVVELEELKERKDLQSVIVQMVIVQITNQMFLGDRLTPFMITFDEAWDMLRGTQSGAFVETLARRLRKYNGSLVVGTQSVNDFYQTPGALAAYENSDWLCLLSQKPESINVLKENKRIDLNPFMEKHLLSVHTKGGAYAECMIVGPHGFAITRLVLDPFSNILYSTKASEYAAVKGLLDQGLSMEDAVEVVAGMKINVVKSEVA
jgi:conjugal transfer ATP-binding protein TraC